jgi:hypothetical protein
MISRSTIEENARGLEQIARDMDAAADASNVVFILPSGAIAGTIIDLDWPCVSGIVLWAFPSGGILAVSRKCRGRAALGRAYFRCRLVYLPSGVRTPIQASRTC